MAYELFDKRSGDRVIPRNETPSNISSKFADQSVGEGTVVWQNTVFLEGARRYNSSQLG